MTQTGNASIGETPRVRNFTYDSLSRLAQSYNPETGWICYGTTPSNAPASGSNCTPGYDANGNLLSKTDGRGIRISYNYDALNRVLTMTSSDGSAYKGYGYDNSANSPGGIGRLFWESNGSIGAGNYYDAMGRTITRIFLLPSSSVWGSTYASYDLAGNITGLTYPDGRHLQQAWDSAGHLCNVTEAISGAISCSTNSSYRYFSSPTYFPSGPLSGVTFGNGVTESHSLNNRLQPTDILVQNAIGVPYMDKRYCYGPVTAPCSNPSPTPNNGNVMDVLNALNPNRSQGTVTTA